MNRSSKVLCDKEDRIFACLAHPPNEDGSWDVVHKGFQAAGERMFTSLGPRKDEKERRGEFESITWGLSIGQGQKVCGHMLDVSAYNQELLDTFLLDPNVRRVISTCNSMFRYYFPKLFGDYVDVLHYYHKLTGDPGDWVPPLYEGIWAAASYNNPPNVMTFEHVDQANKANGICPIFSFGDFNAKTGGHLVLRQLKLVIEFPPGCFIFIPSATLIHGNIRIGKNEERGSFTMFTAGGLFRWVAYGGQTEKEMKERDGKRWYKDEEPKRAQAWVESMSQFSTVSSLHTDRVYCNGRKEY
ncbi:hypothetical protein BDY19DRAFT_897955 [Irpex rosettiformis]|uniref:Uncharacterized protein n=1 Tax=Irpex rosettiformis TaxID=378272 RepID=A0ACB8TRP7_9APHY|nr:hypothetical protein BDY19DRAFT_897955 [Irpex rosettiformis]